MLGSRGSREWQGQSGVADGELLGPKPRIQLCLGSVSLHVPLDKAYYGSDKKQILSQFIINSV